LGLCTEITRYPVCDDVAVSATATRFIFADWCARATSGDAADECDELPPLHIRPSDQTVVVCALLSISERRWIA
jgi:hypothetical protein